jgi:hypothetical protein
MLLASLESTSKTASEVLDVLGPRIQFLTALSDNDQDYCLIRGTVPVGVVVPPAQPSLAENILCP